MLIRKIVNTSSVALAILCGIGIYFDQLPVITLGIIAIVWLGITVYGVLNMSMEFFLKSKRNKATFKDKAIAITFDDGPNEQTLQILALLKRYNTKATFFCIGKQVEHYPTIATQIIEEGHQIGNHTYSHAKWIDLYGTAKFTEEIRKADQVIHACIGKTPRLFRPPYGITNPDVARAVNNTGHEVIGWNKRSFDTALTSEKWILKKITTRLKSGDVILLHDTKTITITVLEQLLLFLQQENFKTLTIDELFEIPAYA